MAGELSISAGGSMVALTVQGPSLPCTVELVDPRSLEWERVDREPSRGPLTSAPTLERITARDGLELTAWLYRPQGEVAGAVMFLHGGPEGRRGRNTTRSSRHYWTRVSRCSRRMCVARAARAGLRARR